MDERDFVLRYENFKPFIMRDGQALINNFINGAINDPKVSVIRLKKFTHVEG